MALLPGQTLHIQYTTICSIGQSGVRFVYSTPRVISGNAWTDTPDVTAVADQLLVLFGESAHPFEDGVSLEKLAGRLRALYPQCLQLSTVGADQFIEKLLREGESKNMCYLQAGNWKPRLTENASNIFHSSIPCATSNVPVQIPIRVEGLIGQGEIQQQRNDGQKTKKYKKHSKRTVTTQESVDDKPEVKISMTREELVESQGLPLHEGKKHKTEKDIGIDTTAKHQSAVQMDPIESKRHSTKPITTQSNVDGEIPGKGSVTRETVIESVGVPLVNIDACVNAKNEADKGIVAKTIDPRKKIAKKKKSEPIRSEGSPPKKEDAILLKSPGAADKKQPESSDGKSPSRPKRTKRKRKPKSKDNVEENAQPNSSVPQLSKLGELLTNLKKSRRQKVEGKSEPLEPKEQSSSVNQPEAKSIGSDKGCTKKRRAAEKIDKKHLCGKCRKWRRSTVKRNLLEIIASLLRQEEQTDRVLHCLCNDCLPGLNMGASYKCRYKRATESISDGSTAPTKCTKHNEAFTQFIP